MKTKELIAELNRLDPSGEMDCVIVVTDLGEDLIVSAIPYLSAGLLKDEAGLFYNPNHGGIPKSAAYITGILLGEDE